MIWNIIDKRTRAHRWKAITAIIERVSHDNSCADSDQADEAEEEFFAYEQRAEISLADAVVWAQSHPSRLRCAFTTLAMASARLTFDKPRVSL